MSRNRTVYDTLDDYLLSHDLAPETANYYRRMVSVLCVWAKRRVPERQFTPQLVNRMLLFKQQAGLSSHYRKSLRAAMRSLLGMRGPLQEKLRTVRLEPLVIEVWTAEEVQRLIDACGYMRDEHKRRWWRTIIAAGYYTGFSPGDLWLLKRAEVQADGRAHIHRSRTRKPVTMRIPAAWLAEIALIPKRKDGKIWGLPMAKETFRQTFARIVTKAKLVGTFKKLRKTCGTSVEMQFPGRGHIALGNTRRVFEQHYFSRERIDDNPMGPDALPPDGPRAA